MGGVPKIGGETIGIIILNGCEGGIIDICASGTLPFTVGAGATTSHFFLFIGEGQPPCPFQRLFCTGQSRSSLFEFFSPLLESGQSQTKILWRQGDLKHLTGRNVSRVRPQSVDRFQLKYSRPRDFNQKTGLSKYHTQ